MELTWIVGLDPGTEVDVLDRAARLSSAAASVGFDLPGGRLLLRSADGLG